MNTTNSEKSVKKLLIHKSWEYLNDNFHKFTETNKIKIALELCKKDLPTEFTGEFKVTQMPQIKVDGQEKEFFVGYPRFTQDVSDTAETTTDN